MQKNNHLRTLIHTAGWRIRDLAREMSIPENTFRGWISAGVIPHDKRASLAQLIGCAVQDIAPQGVPMQYMPKVYESVEEWDGCFSFGSITTTSLVLDGNGEEPYLASSIHTHYDPQPATFFPEVMQAKEQIKMEQDEKQRVGEPYQWNGDKYHLSRIVVSREPAHEAMTLGLWFKPRDHYTGLATRRCLDDPAFRAKYLDDHDWYTPVVGMSMSMGVDLLVVSADGHALLTQRGAHQSVHGNMYHCSISEAVSPAFDRNTTSQAPDLYRCACRGLTEELGLREPSDFSASDIQFLSFTVDTHYALYGLRGMVHVKKNAEEILRHWQAGVKDKMENTKLLAVPFTPKDLLAFVFAHESWTDGLVCLYHALVHEYGRGRVDRVLSTYS